MFDKEKSIILLNKSDIVMCDNNINEANEKFINDLSENGYRIVSFSTKTGNGYESFRDYIMNMFFNNDINIHNETFITSERHMEALRSAIESLKLVISNISYMMPEDLLIIDLMDAFTALGEITGETVSDSLIDKIFSEFCMGK